MKAILDDDFSMPSFPGMAWMEGDRDRVNADPEMALIGGWFTIALSFTFGEQRYVVSVERGRIANINAAPRVDARAAFGFRAPMAVWSKFVSPDPPALYHDFFAMLMRVPEFVLEGGSPRRRRRFRSNSPRQYLN